MSRSGKFFIWLSDVSVIGESGELLNLLTWSFPVRSAISESSSHPIVLMRFSEPSSRSNSIIVRGIL